MLSLVGFLLVIAAVALNFAFAKAEILRNFPIESWILLLVGSGMAFVSWRRRRGKVRLAVLILAWVLAGALGTYFVVGIPIHRPEVHLDAGTSLPPATLLRDDGTTETLPDPSLPGRATLVVFFRGRW